MFICLSQQTNLNCYFIIFIFMGILVVYCGHAQCPKNKKRAVYFLELELEMVVSYHLEPGFLWFESESSGGQLMLFFFLYCKDSFVTFIKFIFFMCLRSSVGRVLGLGKWGPAVQIPSVAPQTRAPDLSPSPHAHEIHCFYSQRELVLALFFLLGYGFLSSPNKYYIYFFQVFQKSLSYIFFMSSFRGMWWKPLSCS